MVSHPDTDVMGLGFPVLVPQTGNASLVVVPNNGVKLSGMIFDAGPVNSPVLLSVGTPGFNSGAATGPVVATPMTPTSSRMSSSALVAPRPRRYRPRSACSTMPTTRSSTTYGPGAPTTAPTPRLPIPRVPTAAAPPFCQVGAGWTYNQGDIGLDVTGNNVTAYGLAVEHYQQNEVTWSGNNGTVIFFQNELPYDPPSQTAWQTSPVQPGYPSFLVTNNVQNFNGYGMASYVVFIYTNATLWDSAAFEAPQSPGVQFTDAMDLFISSTCSVNGDCPNPSQSGGDDSVIDGVGGPATFANVTAPVDVNSYVNGVATLP